MVTMAGLEIFEGEGGGVAAFREIFFSNCWTWKWKKWACNPPPPPPPPPKKKLQNIIFFVKIFWSKVGALYPNL